MKIDLLKIEKHVSSLFEKHVLYIRPFLLVLFFFNALYAAVQNSGVCDELGAHIPCGYVYWTTGVFGGGINNPPLGQLIITLPVKILGLSYDLYTEQHLLLFRFFVIVMGVLLGDLIYRFATIMFDRSAGIAALFIYVLSPNILAHSSLATLDLAVTFFIFLTVFVLYRYIEKPTLYRILALSAAISMAILIKVQALLLLLITSLCFLLFFKEILPNKKKERLLLFCSWMIIPITILILANLVYLNFPPATGELIPVRFVEAVKGKLFHAERGHFSYLMGNYSEEGWWYYFPVAILLKTPLPILLLVLAGLFRRHNRKSILFLIIPVFMLLALAMKSGINIGLRHVLTIYPFLFILASYPLSRLWRTSFGKVLLIVVLLWYSAQAVFITPHFLSYFNVIAGGPKNGHRYLIDSNYDWGQNDHFVRRYVAKERGEYLINPDPFTPTDGNILVNANAYYGVLNRGKEAYSWLKNFEPINQIAYTWFEFIIPNGTFPDAPDYENLQQSFIHYLIDIRDRFTHLNNVEYYIQLARFFATFRAYDLALSELRSLLLQVPDCGAAFAMGGEMIVRYKLGVLPFRGIEYISGRHLAERADVIMDEAYIIQMAKRTGLGGRFSELYNMIGAELYHDQNITGAIDAFEKAIDFYPDNRSAKNNLEKALQSK